MDDDLVEYAVIAVEHAAIAMGLSVAQVDVLQNSNKLAVRLLPCGVLALRGIDIETPHFLDRVSEAEQVVTNRDATPGLDPAGRDEFSSE